MPDPDDTDEGEWRMTVVCTDGTKIGCENFKAIDNGVLLTEDLKRNKVFGFVSDAEVRFVLPSETAEQIVRNSDKSGDEFDDPLKQIPGIGSTYAKRLQSAGYKSLSDVAGADLATLADETGARESETQKWVKQAEKMTGDDADESLSNK